MLPETEEFIYHVNTCRECNGPKWPYCGKGYELAELSMKAEKAKEPDSD